MILIGKRGFEKQILFLPGMVLAIKTVYARP